MLTHAVSLAVKSHHGQYRKHRGPNGTPIPYVFHCMETAKLLWDWGIDDENMLTAMVEHDVFEDTNITVGDVEKEFNKSVAKIVDELTFLSPKGISSAERDALKAKYVDSFSHKSIEGVICKLSDRFCNTWDKLRAGNKSAINYFHKADTLIAAWQERRGEVVKRFGQVVQDHIQKDYDTLVANLR